MKVKDAIKNDLVCFGCFYYGGVDGWSYDGTFICLKSGEISADMDIIEDFPKDCLLTEDEKIKERHGLESINQ